MSNVTPISEAKMPNAEMKRLLQEQVPMVYRAMNLVGTTAKSFPEKVMDPIGTLEAASEILAKVAEDLGELADFGLNAAEPEE